MKSRKIIIVFVNILFVISMYCCVPDEVILPGDISGHVTDAETGDNLETITITLNPTNTSVNSGSEGEYILKNIDPGNYNLNASNKSYHEETKDIGVLSGKTTEVNFELVKIPHIGSMVTFLDFGLELSEKDLIIQNLTNETLAFSLTVEEDWISVSPESGELTSGHDTIKVIINRTLLSQNIHNGKINNRLIIGTDIRFEEIDVSLNGVVDREGNVYQVVKIGSQTWMAENLNLGNMISYEDDEWPEENRIIEKFCYNDDENNCDIYGGLYSWNEMTEYTHFDSVINPIQGICPDGWHIPTKEDFTILTDYLGGYQVAGGAMKEDGNIEDRTGIWMYPNTGATNESGFTARPGGLLRMKVDPPGTEDWTKARFERLGEWSSIWTTDVTDPSIWEEVRWYYVEAAIGRCNTYDETFILTYGAALWQSAASVRCIKDQ